MTTVTSDTSSVEDVLNLSVSLIAYQVLSEPPLPESCRYFNILTSNSVTPPVLETNGSA